MIHSVCSLPSLNKCSTGQKVKEKESQKKTVTMTDAQDPYEHDEDILGENIQEGNDETKANGVREHIRSPKFS